MYKFRSEGSEERRYSESCIAMNTIDEFKRYYNDTIDMTFAKFIHQDTPNLTTSHSTIKSCAMQIKRCQTELGLL